MALNLVSMDRDSFSNMASKYLYYGFMFIDYIPFIGPMYNATYALNLLFNIWPIKILQSFSMNENGSNEVEIEKARLMRVKGLTAIATALIDIFTLCLTLGVLAFSCDCLNRIDTFAFVRQLMFVVVTINMLALTVGSKVITGQLVEHLTGQLEEINTVGTSMVKSVTITATAIERIVETTNSKTSAALIKVNYWWTRTYNIFVMIYTFPIQCFRAINHQMYKCRTQIGNKVRLIRYSIMPFRKRRD
ncbi:hypothetical protein RDWZM_006194 [Blomia tropicalis]|uniref:Uncharacterized protein n=1 Tax=Blomia tropicalis TaxID=40697 RepID=A0A9Q0M9W0_BLOTA|nr:hypothetical protein RDWZM_006194 [Blomia tropicalis]